LETKELYTLSKEERLFLQKRIDYLFAKGDSFIAYPLRVVFCTRETEDEKEPPVAILASVSKRKFKRAVKRNRVKRLIRESYRLNKTKFIQIAYQAEKPIDIAFLYLKNELPDYTEIEKAMVKASIILREKILLPIEDESNS
jgi:ribonuclease P protein component